MAGELKKARAALWTAISGAWLEHQASEFATREQLAQRKTAVNDEMGRLIAAAMEAGRRQATHRSQHPWCPFCGSQEAKVGLHSFCPSCGTKLLAAPAPPQAEPAPEAKGGACPACEAISKGNATSLPHWCRGRATGDREGTR